MMKKLSIIAGVLGTLAVLAAPTSWAQEKTAPPIAPQASPQVPAQASPAVQGQRGFGKRGPQYNPQAAETLSGKVVSIKRLTARRPGRPAHVTMTVKTDKGTIRVALGPADYIDQQTVKMAAGDQVEVKGVQVTRFNRTMFVAGEVKKGEQVLKLRDEATGKPLWTKGMKAKGS